ncbi:MAG: FAD-dependent oxidoreductase, partial [Clostridia bacterium]|nr:FAD-dependent oxidoreductase [Clostridia bacterium]
MVDINEIKRKMAKAGYAKVVVSEKNGGVLLQGEMDDYSDIVEAGRLAVDKNSRGVINNIRLKNYAPKPMRMPSIEDKLYDGETPDVVIIGGGIVGCAIARELSRYKLNIMLLEKEYDVAVAQSSRNDGMIHAGIDLKPDSNKVKYNMRGNKLYDTLSKELDVPISKCGQCVLFTERWQKLIMPIIKLRARKNNIPIKYVNNKEIAEMLPKAGFKFGGLMCYGAGIVSPYLMTVALAENAIKNGAQVCLNTAVTDIENDGKKILSVTTNRGKIYPKVVINASGVFSDIIAEMAGDRFFTIHPRKGVEGVLDSKASKLTSTVLGRFILGSSGKSHTKGGGVIKTIDNNLLIGPSAFEVIEREDESTDREGLMAVYEKQRQVAPDLK